MRQVPRFPAGQRLTTLRGNLNRLVDRVNGDVTPRGSVGAGPGFAPARIFVLQIRTLEFDPNQLTCTLPMQELNPSAETWSVDPPPTFTEPSRNGVSYVYSTINDRVADGTETQVLTPLYIINDLIWVTDYEEDGTYRDLNIDGRQWAAVP